MNNYMVRLILESGHFVTWEGEAEDESHAEGLAIAEQVEQVYEMVFISNKTVQTTEQERARLWVLIVPLSQVVIPNNSGVIVHKQKEV